jgi:hypothetical protein
MPPESYFVNSPTKEVERDTITLKINGAMKPLTTNPGT